MISIIELCPSPVFGPTIKNHAVLPFGGQLHALTANDARLADARGGVEAGREDHRIHRIFLAAGRDDRPLAKLDDRRRDDVDVIAGERRIEVVRKQHALATHPIRGREFGAEFLAGHALCKERKRHALARTQQCGIADEAERAHLEHPVNQPSLQPRVAGHAPAAPALARGHGAIGAR
jgi:hypothetical protein